MDRRHPGGLSALLLLSAIPAVAGDSRPIGPPLPLLAAARQETGASPEAEAAERFLAAWKSGDEAKQRVMARDLGTDPWLVAHELCARNGQDAAVRYAAALPPGEDLRRLPEYVASRAGRSPPDAGRRALAAARAAIAGGRAARALELLDGQPAVDDAVLESLLAYERGNALQALDRSADGIAAFLSAAGSAERIGWLMQAEQSVQDGAHGAIGGGDLRTAAGLFEREAAIAAARRSPGALIEALRNEAVILRNLSDYEKALACVDRAIQACRPSKDDLRLASALIVRGEILRCRGDLEGALAALGKALEIVLRLKDAEGIAEAYTGVGEIHRERGEWTEAIACYSKAREANEGAGDRRRTLALLADTGICQRGMGDYDLAFESMNRALDLSREIRLPYNEALCLGNIALLHADLGDYARALALQEAALALNRKVGNRSAEAHSLGEIGNLQFLLGDVGRALETQREVLRLEEAIGDAPGASRATANIGACLQELGRIDEALPILERARDLAEAAGDGRALASRLCNLGLLRRKRGDLEGALALQEKALALCGKPADRPVRALVLVNLGELRRLSGKPAEGLALAVRALAEAEEIGLTPIQVAALEGISACHLALGRPDEALDAARLGVQRMARLVGGLAEEEGARARERHLDLLNAGIEAARRKGDPAAMFHFLESARAMAMIESLGARRLLAAVQLPEGLRGEESRVRRNEAIAHRLLRDAVERGDLRTIRDRRLAAGKAGEAVREVVARIRREAKAKANLVYPEPAPLDRIRALLGADEALVLYALSPAESCALLVLPGGARIVPLGPGEEIRRACDALDAGNPAVDAAAALAGIRARVLGTLGLPAGVRRLLVSADGELFTVPFAALAPDLDIVCVPSGTAWEVLRSEETARGRGVLALGDPDCAARGPEGEAWGNPVLAGLKPLPASRLEAVAVGTVLLLGREATEANFARNLASPRGAARWRAVHLACHGKVDPSQPLGSWLALAPDAESDGLLTVLDVFGASVPADLVALSACESGRGKVYRAEGMVGFPRAFLTAGASRLVTSLWKVDDEATRALMSRFYALWNPKDGTPGMAAAAALREAQRFVRSQEKWEHPAFWASWQLWGLGD